MRKIVQKIIFELLNEAQKVKLLNLIKSKKAFDILDSSKAPETTWQQGGCWILADALSIFYNSPLYVVFNKTLNHVDHFVVQISPRDVFLDSDGFQSAKELIGKTREDIGPKHWDSEWEVVEFHDGMNTGDIPRDLEASQKLVDLFSKYQII